MRATINPKRVICKRDKMIYGHFLEHFHRQIYGGVFDPGNPLSDETGLRTDVLEALREIEVPILRWPGGCFVSSYHWKDAVGKNRTASFNKSWRVEEPNTFGTDEYIEMCRKIGCEPYICTNAGSGTEEEMSDWVEYCNLESEGKYAKWRIENGHKEPYNVKYWSIGNENYGQWEIGAKDPYEWSRCALESAKMMKHVDPTTELSVAALWTMTNDLEKDVDWNVKVLNSCGKHLHWLSIHKYWDRNHEVNTECDYATCMGFTGELDQGIQQIRGTLMALGLDKKVRIAFDEWNLRGWYHPNAHAGYGIRKEDYLYPRDGNDINSLYTMADTVFTACFLNTCNRNADIVGMANYAPTVNARGCIYTHKDGIVLRGTYYVFKLFVKLMGDTIIDLWEQDPEYLRFPHLKGGERDIAVLDVLATLRSDGAIAVSAMNKDPEKERELTLQLPNASKYRIHTLNGDSTEAYNDIGHDGILPRTGKWISCGSEITLSLEPHSVNIIEIF